MKCLSGFWIFTWIGPPPLAEDPDAPGLLHSGRPNLHPQPGSKKRLFIKLWIQYLRFPMKVKLLKTLDCHTKPTGKHRFSSYMWERESGSGIDFTCLHPWMTIQEHEKAGKEHTISNQAMNRPGTHAAFAARKSTVATNSASPLMLFRAPGLAWIGGDLEREKGRVVSLLRNH